MCAWLPHAENKYKELLLLLTLVSPSVEILALTQGRALLIWYKICSKDIVHGIEWHSFAAELVDKHHGWFDVNNELDKLAAGESCKERQDAVTSAVKRNAPRVLRAVYQSLCATQFRGGAAQHASIAEKIQKESEFVCFLFDGTVYCR